jgi:hypothetical protein
MIKQLFLALALLSWSASFAQEDLYTLNYSWNEDPMAITCPDSLLNEPELNLKKVFLVEFTYDDAGDFVEYDLFHRVSYLGSDEAIENNNRVYLPIGNDETLELSKARAINPNGKVIELSEDDIKSAEDEEGNMTYYYAFKGLEKGSIIEYYYVQKNPAEYTGTRIIFQNDIIQLNSEFDIISPWNLVFTYKGFNGFGEMMVDTSNEEVNHLYIDIAYIPKFKFENQSFYRSNAMQVVYKLDENTLEKEQNIISYTDMANYVMIAYTNGSKNEVKVVKKWIKESGISKDQSKEQQLRSLEVYLKQNYAIIDISSDELKDLEFVNENKITNPLGFIKAIAIACDQLDIDYEVVMTSSRTDEYFDSSFEAYNFLDLYLMYFPAFDKYIDPSDSFSSLGIISPYYQDNYGVFFKEYAYKKLKLYESKIRFIEGSSAEASHHDMFMNVSMNKDFTALDVELETISTGQFAAGIQPYYDVLEPNDILSANEDQVKWIGDGIEVEKVSVQNSGFSELGVEPFLLTASFSSSEFVSKARDNYLIKIGMLIGPQTEMYQDSKRTMPVNSDFRKHYHRELNFTIPEGYRITNLESIDINNSAEDENGVYALFQSSYSVQDNILHITCDEYYKKVNYKVTEYEDYRKIINSAADFNKIVLFLEKTN